MKKREFLIKKIAEYQNIIDFLHHNFKLEKKMVFIGEIGAGKTTFIKLLCKSLGVNEMVSSPTFSLVNEYELEDKSVIRHIDLYRIKNEFEAINFGIEDYLYDSNYCFIEWPEIIEYLLPEKYVKLIFKVEEDESRKIIISLSE